MASFLSKADTSLRNPIPWGITWRSPIVCSQKRLLLSVIFNKSKSSPVGCSITSCCSSEEVVSNFLSIQYTPFFGTFKYKHGTRVSKVSLGFHRNMERLASDYKFIGENQNNSGVHSPQEIHLNCIVFMVKSRLYHWNLNDNFCLHVSMKK